MLFLTALLPSLALLSFSCIFSSVFAVHFLAFDSPVHDLDSLAASLRGVFAFEGHTGRQQIPRFENAQVQSTALFHELLDADQTKSLIMDTGFHHRSFINLGRTRNVVNFPGTAFPVATTVAVPIGPDHIAARPGETTFLVLSAGPSGVKGVVNLFPHGYVKISNAPGIETTLPTRIGTQPPFEIGNVLTKWELAQYADNFGRSN
ncbi:uncharacterized protein MEPE_06097 [Melanopsichium pennsylvanicum]|uniref:Uncharacterized protein n=2 Tax=Melanopsichium pennsylvanicum TaxID=63383 RepID=A0AAJ4XT36_9BASI|nr:uncharacterized protein BN887_02631 [Melanopsichium pennsylvanicum 4]SNX87387.1 uncharacterized protein MEPE_06097 [Melanopsichium pennsylvanicum]